MESIESLRRKIVTAGELGSVVRTMKALAAVSIHQYQKAVEALTEVQQHHRNRSSDSASRESGMGSEGQTRPSKSINCSGSGI